MGSFVKEQIMRILGSILILLVLLSMGYDSGAQTSAWPMFRHDLLHTGRTPFSGPAAPVVIWSFQTDEAIASSASLAADGTIYIGGLDFNLYAVDPDGTEKWRYFTDWCVFSSPIIGPDGAVELINNAAKKLFDIPRLGKMGDLAKVSPELVDILKTIEPGGSELVKITVGGDLLQIYVYATELRLRRTVLKLVSFQNISPELEAKEMEAWQNLIRVLTHEIKNSLTPIASLTSSMEEMLAARERADTIDDETLQDIHEALRTIKKRSEGLLRFTDAYRSLTRIKEPEMQSFPVSELVQRVEKLSKGQIAGAGGSLVTRVEPPDLKLHADPQLVEQVLINLLLNSIDAVSGKEGGRIEISAFVDGRNHIVIRVTDDGRGIVPEALEKIFIPFFSTKKEGSGIGLSLSRQIMRLHRGDLTVESEPGVSTAFTMRF